MHARSLPIYARLTASAILLLLFIAAAPLPCAAQDTPLPVLVSIAPQKYLVERIAGDAVSVTVLVQPGADPHAYEPAPSQIRAASAASVWYTIGVPFEDAWVPRITGAAKGLETASFIKGIKRLAPQGPLDADEHHHDEGGAQQHEHGEDPHVWLSPMLVREMLPGIAKDLGKRLPEKAKEFRQRAQALGDELEQLDKDLAMRFADVPESKRVFLTFHPSWRYFAFNYQLTELSIEVEGKEPGPKMLQQVADSAKKYGITTIFVEPQFPKASAKAVAEAIGAEIVEADPLAENVVETYRSMTDKLIRSFH